MYNRYIPQPDGTYRRSQSQDNTQRPQQPSVPPSVYPEPGIPHAPHRGGTGHSQQSHGQQQKKRCAAPSPPLPPKSEPYREYPRSTVGGFLKNLLPKDFDTGDLLIVLLLLLMAGDCPEEQNTALLTLVLYLFL